MIAGIAIGAFVLVAGFAGWSRFAPRRAERRSVTTHQHALDVLGTVSRRWEGVAPVHLPKPDEVARAHVQPTGAPSARRRADGGPAPIRRPGVRLVPLSGSTPLKLPIFVDDKVVRSRAPDEPDRGEAGTASAAGSVRLGRAALFDHEALNPVGEFAARPSRRIRHRYRGGRPARRATSTAAAAVAIAAIGVASWQLASGGAPAHRASKPLVSTAQLKPHSRAGGHTSGPGLVPTSVSPSVVAYATTSRTYTISFAASAPCWLGVQEGVNGKYLWMTTLEAGGTVSYRASGPIAVRLGAPPHVRVQVDGVNVALPAQNVQPYDITFSPTRHAVG